MRQFADELGDGEDGRRGRRSAVERKSYRLDNGRTDHHAVRGFCDRPGAFGVLDAEADRDRQIRCGASSRATPSATSLTSGAAAPVTPVIETK